MAESSVPLALLSALLFAVSAALQQHAARRTAAGPAPPGVPALLAGVAREPLWWWGWSAGAAGFCVQALALRLGSIVVVQALNVTQLLFALPLAAALTGRRPLRRDWWGAAAVCAGLILLVTVRGGVEPAAGHRSRTWLVVVVSAGIVASLLVLARRLRPCPQARAVALAVASGVCFCMTAVFLVFAGEEVSRHGLLAGAFGPPTAGLVVSTATGTVLVQNAFAGGSLPTALTAMTITDPVASWIAGVVVFGGRPAVGAGALGAGVLVAAGVALLASSPTSHDQRLPPSRA
ncbi:DMT family transporter [Actinoallomurus iriomotensis]|uniref:Integral membrane protein n=1 Tax=Actinoallomurus iriomotensis TaxID=478107 RepID=A0A9W6VQC2_9ACTN|nr:DMT family transporter [Actinoallomurus iriomotensis]GLY75714.1 hypothetical protein Airi01_039810 [Actinoallomurus iriomotensis]